jgi:putative two-component system response regulator
MRADAPCTLSLFTAITRKLALRQGGGLIAAMLVLQAGVLGVGGYLTLGAAKQGVEAGLRQSASGDTVSAHALTHEAIVWATASGVVLLGLSLVGTSIVIRKYDNVLVRMNKQLGHEVERRSRQSLVIRNGLIFGLAKLADYRDTDTGRHLERICSYSGVLAEALHEEFAEITPAWVERIKLAASMHDIGKVGIPDAILLKPGRFTPDERKIMETHPVIGADTLISIRRRVGDDELMNMGIQVTLSHHERWDGKGYPFGLVADQIPLSARIVALADMYDALTSKRVYKAAMTHDEAKKIIVDSRGTHFDERIVDAFLRIHKRFDDIRRELATECDTRESFTLPESAKAVEAERARLAA